MSSSKKFLIHSSLVTVLALTLIGGVFSAYVYSLCKVKTIKIEGVSKNTVLYGLEGIRDSSLFLLSVPITENLIKKSNPFISSVSVVKQYPQTVTLSIFLYEPFAFFQGDKGFFMISQDGHILKKIKSDEIDINLPIIHYFETLNFSSYVPGEKIDLKDVQMALNFLKEVKSQNMQVNTIDINGVDVIAFKLKDKEIVFSSGKDGEGQIYQLEQIIHQFRIQGKDFKKLDLRFNKPVLELTE